MIGSALAAAAAVVPFAAGVLVVDALRRTRRRRPHLFERMTPHGR